MRSIISGHKLTCAAAALIALACGYMAMGGAESRPAADDAKPLYDRVRAASVKILVNGRQAGSGCFVRPDGVVLTACHVVRNPKKHIEIISPLAGRLTAKRIATDYGHDLALLRVEGGPKKYPYLEVAPRMPAALEDVILFSSPIWRHDLALKGSVARPETSYCWQQSLDSYMRCIYIGGASPVGSSGGCWVDSHGRIVAVQGGYLNHADKSPVGIAYASPPDAIARLVSGKEGGQIATLGAACEELWTQSEGFIARLPKGTRGIVSPRLMKGGALMKAGLTRETVILAVDGKDVEYLDELLGKVRSKKPGDEITLKVIEPIGKPPRKVKIRLGKVKQ